jgi:phosphoribosyl-dephospho-CoA transferase
MTWLAPFPELQLRRHDVVHIHRDARTSRVHDDFNPELFSIVDEWIALGRPFVARRPGACDGAGLPLGLPLPPSLGKARIAITVAREAIATIAPPPTLLEIQSFAPPAWRSALDDVLALCAKFNIELRAFGSLAWQCLIGLDYLTPTSDVDLIFLNARRSVIAPLFGGLAEIEAKAPLRLDGEVVRADGAATNWRELCTDPREVLVKTLDGVLLQSPTEFVEGLERCE